MFTIVVPSSHPVCFPFVHVLPILHHSLLIGRIGLYGETLPATILGRVLPHSRELTHGCNVARNDKHQSDFLGERPQFAAAWEWKTLVDERGCLNVGCVTGGFVRRLARFHCPGGLPHPHRISDAAQVGAIGDCGRGIEGKGPGSRGGQP